MAGRSEAESMTLVGRVLLIVAYALLLGFHVLPNENPSTYRDKVQRGWEIWPELWNMLDHWDQFWGMVKNEPLAIMALVALITWVFLCAASPFLVPLFLRSRILWGISTLMSGLCLIPLAMVMVPMMERPDWSLSELPPAALCLLISPVLNFFGLIFIRRDRRDVPALPT